MDVLHRRLVGLVVALVALTLGGMAVLWPSSSDLPPPGDPLEALHDGTIRSIEPYEMEADVVAGLSGSAAILEVEVTSGPDAGDLVTIDTPLDGYPALSAGDRVKLSRSDMGGEVSWFVVDFVRTPALWWLLALFVATVVGIGGVHGLRALAGLALSLVVVTQFVVPAILAGTSPFAVAFFGALAVMLATLYLAHGVNAMTSAAVVGTTGALAVTIVLGLLFIDTAQLTGFSSEEANLARFAIEGLDLQGLVLAGLIIAALGVLDDVTVSQASTVFALRDANPTQRWSDLFGRAMRVGRDHIASTVNTLVLAYVGASLALLVLFSTGGVPMGELINSEVIAEEIVKTLVGSIGLISAVPLTTALAASLAVRMPVGVAATPGGHVHVHADPVRAPAPAGDPDDPDGEDDGERDYGAWIEFLKHGGSAPPDDEAPQ